MTQRERTIKEVYCQNNRTYINKEIKVEVVIDLRVRV